MNCQFCFEATNLEAGKQFRICLGLKRNLFCRKFVAKSTPLGMSNEGADIDGATGFARPVFGESRDEVGDIGGCEHSHNSMQFF